MPGNLDSCGSGDENKTVWAIFGRWFSDFWERQVTGTMFGFLSSYLLVHFPPLLPVWKMMSAPVVPAPEVERRLRVDVVAVPRMISGEVSLVKIVGLVESTTFPAPVTPVMVVP